MTATDRPESKRNDSFSLQAQGLDTPTLPTRKRVWRRTAPMVMRVIEPVVALLCTLVITVGANHDDGRRQPLTDTILHHESFHIDSEWVLEHHARVRRANSEGFAGTMRSKMLIEFASHGQNFKLTVIPFSIIQSTSVLKFCRYMLTPKLFHFFPSCLTIRHPSVAISR